MYKFSLFLVVLSSFAHAQTAILTGRIANAVGDSVFVSHYDMTLLEEVFQGAALSPEGAFALQLTPQENGEHYFKHGTERTKIRLHAGDSLHLRLDYLQFDESLVFTGTSAAINNYLAAHYLKFLDHPDYEQNLTMAYQFKIRKLDPWPYMAWMDSVTDAQLQFLEIWKNQLSNEDYVFEHGRITYEGVNRKGLYKGLRYFFAEQLEHIKIPEYPETLEDFYMEVPLNQDELVLLDDYLMASHHKIMQLVRPTLSAISKETPEYALAYLQMVDSLCSATVAHHLGKYWVVTSMERSGPDLLGLAVQHYLQSTAPTSLKNELQEAYSKAKGFSSGAPAFDFELKNAEGKLVRLSDYAGKFVYLDFWATWCEPCLAELKYVEKNQIQSPDSNFVFLYISVDEDEATWRKSMAKYLPNAQHLWGKGINTNPAQAYGIRSLPNYFLIGPDGTFISTNPPRPSSGQLYNYLHEEQLRYNGTQ